MHACMDKYCIYQRRKSTHLLLKKHDRESGAILFFVLIPLSHHITEFLAMLTFSYYSHNILNFCQPVFGDSGGSGYCLAISINRHTGTSESGITRVFIRSLYPRYKQNTIGMSRYELIKACVSQLRVHCQYGSGIRNWIYVVVEAETHCPLIKQV